MVYIGFKVLNGVILISIKLGLGIVGKKVFNFRIICFIGY